MSNAALVPLKATMSIPDMVAAIRKHITDGGATVRRSLESVNLTFFVRMRLDENRVFVLADEIEGGQRLDPMVVTINSNELIDGRHRKEARARQAQGRGVHPDP
ncbi:MAG: hypothetical protein A3B10_00615 [Candidatus Doudnabacteria bacterium RIFCSPLOWO2_01_FULL_44_21]|uniref:ParB/Sulfiredoxin domain-containing protein n=1 Tax=Candidatus Doudnabacteria bacterium RIFCSPLOWO2_01_FULL_44_21 TaxID=1817841 RepID=A0A1F5PXH4_9BACT|nr:MAG: hypothetical protein A3B95_00475 [Candidatus Doudnabacteria bacterium RIFCSPHIGHO2_02_FULL_43_13b]OGE94641.1 MAG: hypothetical protein A3B10_00615 [Candidatus Doudnabacteria bacterium RIFCSPLOWO2_01_FULL_44_21]